MARPPAIYSRLTFAIEVSSTSMKVGIEMIATISHGFKPPATDRVGSQPSLRAALATVSAP